MHMNHIILRPGIPFLLLLKEEVSVEQIVVCHFAVLRLVQSGCHSKRLKDPYGYSFNFMAGEQK